MSFSSLKTFLINGKRATDHEPPHRAGARTAEQEKLVKMVGKSNKFDYTNRSTKGTRLGEIIGDAFRKEVPKAQQHAARYYASQLRKRSIDSDSSKEMGIHIIDLKLPNKALGDAGARAMVPGILEAIKAQGGDAHICLEDINLSGNELTVEALAMLGPVVRASFQDLKTLDLSNNNITIETDVEVADFETFLMSFSHCLKLRRLDLSGNKNLGAKAMEVFSRVFFAEKPVVPLPTEGEGSVASLEDDYEEIENEAAQEVKDTTTTKSMSDAIIFARRCGLRSLPYINLTDTGLDDLGALWLSTIIPYHYYPIQLIDERNAAPVDTEVAIYQQGYDSAGIEWGANEDTLGRDGLELLQNAEDIRRSIHLDKEGVRGQLLQVVPKFLGGDDSQPIIPPEKYSGLTIEDRTAEHEIFLQLRKMSRQVIKQQGTQAVDLWNASIKLVSLSRRLFVLSANSMPQAKKRAGLKVKNVNLPPQEDTEFPKPMSMELRLLEKSTNKAKKMSPPAPIHIPHHNEFMNGWEIEQSPYGFADLDAAVQRQLLKSRMMLPQSRHFANWQMQHENRNADKTQPWMLPFSIWKKIAGYVLTKQEMQVLGARQHLSVYNWGMHRETLQDEMEWVKLAKSYQIWQLLASVGCLRYNSAE